MNNNKNTSKNDFNQAIVVSTDVLKTIDSLPQHSKKPSD